mgnify:CR=1 FL=1
MKLKNKLLLGSLTAVLLAVIFHSHPEPIGCTRHVGHYSGKSTSPTKEYVHKELQRSGVTLNLL